MLGRGYQIGVSFEIQTKRLAHAPVRASSGCLQHAIAAEKKTIAGLSVTEFPRLSRIAETIYALRQGSFVMGQARRFGCCYFRRVITDAEYLQHARNGVAHAFSQDFEATGFGHCLSHEMTHPHGSRDAVFFKQWTTLTDRLEVIVFGLRRELAYNRNGFG